jgi:predicted Fe-Mo cluster-binding NifX family protein
MPKTIAIPTRGPTLDALTEIAVPHSRHVLLLDPDTGEFEAHDNPAWGVGAHPGMFIAKFLIDRGVTTVLGHHMGPHPAAALTKKGIRVHEGRPGATAAQLFALFREGKLPVLNEAEINERHGPHHHHGDHEHGDHGHGHDHGGGSC